MKRTISFATMVFAAACAQPAWHPVQPAPAPSAPAPAAPPAPATQPAPAQPAAHPETAIVQQAAEPRNANVSPSAGPSVAESAPTGPSPADSGHVAQADVTRRAVELFGDAPVAADVAPAAAVAESTAAGPSWDIDVRSYETTDRVEHYVRLFSTSARAHIASRLEHGTRYESMIRSKMRLGGIPEDMYYLALVESGFDPNAYSRAAAVGMWQFMTSTARDMGMRVDWWVDERRDPFRSTTAAVQFIKGLRDQFGSLYLAAAAYNGGPGRVARGLSRYADDFEGTSGDDLFFALAEKDYLRNETREYVPQLIAAALIAKEPSRYGMKIEPQAAVEYDSVRVGPMTALPAVAHAAGVTIEAVKDLNPHVLRGVTPPRDSFFVRVPVGTVDSFAVAFAAMPKSERGGLSTMESRKGESLASIARKNGISEKQLESFNPKLKRLKSGNLAAGQTVLVPTPAVASAATLAPDPSIERYGSSRTKSATMHVVKSGESLSTIAKKYGTTSDALMRANGLKRPLIFPGQSLVVKGGVRSAKASAKPSKNVDKAESKPTKKVAKPAKAKRTRKPTAKSAAKANKKR